MRLSEAMWVERYRPRKLEDLVLPDEYRELFQSYIDKRSLDQHVLFFGGPGGGKTATARILTSKFGVLKHPDENLLQINGSAKSTRGIDFVDDVIEPFLIVPPAGEDINKIVFIDEFEYFTKNSMFSLRGIIEKYQTYGRFVLTCNYISKVIPEIMSRVPSYEFKKMPIESVENYCKKILEDENVVYKEKDLKYVINNLYPDIRQIVQCLQKNSMSNTLSISRETVLTQDKLIIATVLEFIEALTNKSGSKVNSAISTIVKILNESEIDYRSVYENLMFNDKVPGNCKIVINEYANKHQESFIPHSHFIGMLYAIARAMKEYQFLIGEK